MDEKIHTLFDDMCKSYLLKAELLVVILIQLYKIKCFQFIKIFSAQNNSIVCKYLKTYKGGGGENDCLTVWRNVHVSEIFSFDLHYIK